MAIPVNTIVTAAISVLAIAAVAVQMKPWAPRVSTVEFELKGTKMDRLDHLVARYGQDAGGNAITTALAADVKVRQIDQPLIADACEVNQLDFHKFALWYGVRRKHESCHSEEPANFIHRSTSRDNAVFGQSSLPAGAVTLFDAIAYCSAAGGRVPADDEWEAVAGGREGRLFPWGNRANPDPWREVHDFPRRCRTFPYTDTPEGVSDLATSVSEWTARSASPLVGSRSGGNAHRFAAELYAYRFLHLPVREGPLHRDPFLGFRCVYDGSSGGVPPSPTPWGSELSVRKIEPGKYPLGPPPEAMTPRLLRLFSPQQVVDHLRRIAATSGITAGRRLKVMAAEVTRGDYRRFLLDPFARIGFYTDAGAPAGHSHVPDQWDEQLRDTSLPVSGIDWWDARAYANWTGGRLPTAEEWAAIASDNSRSLYPWGGQYKAGITCTTDAPCSSPASASQFSSDATKAGVRHLGGSVSEWTATLTRTPSGPSLRGTVVGGNFRLKGIDASLASFQTAVPLAFRDPAIGFRLVFD